MTDEQGVRNLLQVFDGFMGAFERARAKNQAIKAVWEAGAEATHYRSVRELVSWFAENSDNLTVDQMTELALIAQIKEYNAGGLYDSSILRRPDYYQDHMARDLMAEPEATFSIRGDELQFNASGFHYLRHRLDYLPKLNVLFYDVFLPAIDEEKGYKVDFDEAIKRFPKWLRKLGFDIDTHDGDYVGSDYACDDLSIDQAFLYTIFHIEFVPEEFQEQFGDLDSHLVAIIQIHTGVDSRYGFSDPVLYSSNPYLPYSVRDGSVGCSECSANWDVGERYYSNDRYPRLTEFPILSEDERPDMPNFGPSMDLSEEFVNLPRKKDWDIDPDDHPIYVKEDGTAICPVCGKGILYGEAPYCD